MGSTDCRHFKVDCGPMSAPTYPGFPVLLGTERCMGYYTSIHPVIYFSVYHLATLSSLSYAAFSKLIYAHDDMH